MSLPTNNPGTGEPPALPTPAPEPQPVPQPAPQPQVDWQKEAESFQKRFNGLQSTYQKERLTWQADSAKLFDSNKQMEELLGQHEALKAQHGTVTEQADLLKTESETAAAQLGRMKYIAEKHPDLLAFELQGLLPDGAAGDELEKTLTAFKGAIGGIVRQVGSAGAPPPPPAQSVRSADELVKLANEASFGGDVLKANQLWDEYFKLQRGG